LLVSRFVPVLVSRFVPVLVSRFVPFVVAGLVPPLVPTTVTVSPRRLMCPALTHALRRRPTRMRGQSHWRPSSASLALTRPPAWARSQSSASGSDRACSATTFSVVWSIAVMMWVSVSGLGPSFAPRRHLALPALEFAFNCLPHEVGAILAVVQRGANTPE